MEREGWRSTYDVPSAQAQSARRRVTVDGGEEWMLGIAYYVRWLVKLPRAGL